MHIYLYLTKFEGTGTYRTWDVTSGPLLVSALWKIHGSCDKSDDAINQHLLSKGIPGGSLYGS